MERIFLDTGYLLALEIENDQNHHVAQVHWRSVKASLPQMVTTSYVFDEIVTFFNSRGYHAKAIQVGQRLLSSPSIRVVYVDERLFHAGWTYFQQYEDKAYSLTDCISFVVMQELGIKKALAFDRHFVQAGFVKEPESS